MSEDSKRTSTLSDGERLALEGEIRALQTSLHALGVVTHTLLNARLRRLTRPLRKVRSRVRPARYVLTDLHPGPGIRQVKDLTFAIAPPAAGWFLPHLFPAGRYRFRLGASGDAPAAVTLIFERGIELAQTIRPAGAAAAIAVDLTFELFAPAYLARLEFSGPVLLTLEHFHLDAV